MVLNGQKTVDAVRDARFATGWIALQKGLGVPAPPGGVLNDRGLVRVRRALIRVG